MAEDSSLIASLQNINFGPTEKNDWNDLYELILQAHVPETTEVDVRPLESKDFESIRPIAARCFNTISRFLRNASLDDFYQQKNSWKCIYSIVILCGEHSSCTLWSDDECVELSRTVLQQTMDFLEYQYFMYFLTKKDFKRIPHGINIFSILQTKLTKESWKYFPSFVHCYSWLLHQILMPSMKEFIGIVLPVPLVILTDHTVESKILGLDCLMHILSNISKTETHWHIDIKLLHDTLRPLFYYREADLILPLTKCTIEVIEISKPGFKNSDINLEWTYLDDVLDVLLPMMEYESDMKRREAYSQSLPLILEKSDFSIGRWSQRLLRIIEDYLKTSHTELNALDALNYYIRSCWPLVQNHWKYITVIIGKIMFESSSEEAVIKSDIVRHTLQSLLPEESIFIYDEYIKTRRRLPFRTEYSESSNHKSMPSGT